jgi:ABC-type nitrate/sulfonate/bicarbonate transport system ATPase subunit
MISLEHVDFYYPQHSPLFSDFNWEVNKGESWAVLGPSGCGKTTLLYLLAGLHFPTHGRLLINEQPIHQPRPQTGLILQDYGLLPWATVRQNIQLGLRLRKFYGPDGKHSPTIPTPHLSIEAWLERLGITDLAHQYPHRLSGGQRQRTAIARTLILHPDLLLMDEPFSSLDALTREGLQNLTLDLWREQGFTFIIVTHAIEEAACLGQKILVLSKPPHHTVKVVVNSSLIQPGFHHSPAYQEICQLLRAHLENSRIDEKA